MQKNPDKFVLVINRKSRIVMKDALGVLKKAEKIKGKIPKASLTLETSAPVCSKSIKFLKEKGIDISKESGKQEERV